MDLKKLVNKGVDSLSPYEPGKPIEDLERDLGIKNAIKLANKMIKRIHLNILQTQVMGGLGCLDNY